MKRVPERLDKKQARAFLAEVCPLLESDRPQLVFDMAQVKHLDAAGVDILIECLSTVMKHDGDIKLASLSPEAAIVLEFTRTGRLFEIYETTAEGVNSFSGFMPNVVKQIYGSYAVAAKPKQESKHDGHDKTLDRKSGDMAA